MQGLRVYWVLKHHVYVISALNPHEMLAKDFQRKVENVMSCLVENFRLLLSEALSFPHFIKLNLVFVKLVLAQELVPNLVLICSQDQPSEGLEALQLIFSELRKVIDTLNNLERFQVFEFRQFVVVLSIKILFLH